MAGSQVTLAELLSDLAMNGDFDELEDATGIPEDMISNVIHDLAMLLDCDWALLKGDRRPNAQT